MFQSDESGRQNKQREEDYEKMFAKIGREFIHIDDFNAWLAILRLSLAPLGVIIPPITNARAISRANEYKKNIEQGKDSKYEDLVDMEESGE